MGICIIFNPAAKGDKARRFRTQLESLAADCVCRPTTGPGTARALATHAVAEGFELIVAVGGDGTVNEVLNGMADAPEGLQRARLGILPLGTANVFARELGLPLGARAAWECLQTGRPLSVDLMRLECRLDGEVVHRWGVQLAGAGLDARAVELVDWDIKKRAGFLAYVAAGFRALRESQPRITADAGSQRAIGELVLVGNGRLYGGPFALFPQADLHDGQMEIRVFPRAGWMTALSCVLGILTGRVGRAGRSHDLRASAVTLTADRRVPVELDGELAGELPARLEIVRGALTVMVPRGTS